jgi:hypothetical protein
VAQDQVEDRVQVGLGPIQLEAAAGELDRRLQQLGPWQPTVGPVQRFQACRGAGDGIRCLADPEDLSRVAVASEADVDRVHGRAGGRRAATARCRDEEIGDPGGPPVAGNDQGEPAGAGPGQGAFRHPARKCGRHTGIDGVSALLEHPSTRLCGQPVPGRDRAIHALVIFADEPCGCAPRTRSSPFPH